MDNFDITREYFGLKDSEPLEVVKISEREKLEKREYISKSFRWVHKYHDGGCWKPCQQCGDLVDIKGISKGGGYTSPEEIKKICSKYGKY